MTIGNKCESEHTKSAAFKITMSFLGIAIVIIIILFLIIVILVCKLRKMKKKIQMMKTNNDKQSSTKDQIN